jgi:hypothetical protein
MRPLWHTEWDGEMWCHIPGHYISLIDLGHRTSSLGLEMACTTSNAQNSKIDGSWRIPCGGYGV